MKLFALIAAVSAEWNGVSEDNTCGMQISGTNKSSGCADDENNGNSQDSVQINVNCLCNNNF